MATYDPRQTFKAQDLAFSRAAGTQTSKQQGLSVGAGTPDNNRGSTYDEVPQVITSSPLPGLGSRSKKEDKKEKTFTEKVYDFFVGAGADVTEPEKDFYAMPVYESPMFKIPTVPEVTEQGIKDPFDQFNVNPFKFGGYDYEARDQAPQVTQMQDPAVKAPPSTGLMSPPSMDQPNTPEPLTNIPRALARSAALPTAKYRVQDGDTLSEIADATGSTVQELADLNMINDVDVIRAGADLEIPIRRIEDKDVVTRAKSMEELKPIKASYALVNALPPLKPNVKQGYTDDDLGIPTGPVPEYMFMTPGSKFTNALKAKEADNYDTLFGNAELFDTPFKDVKVSDMTVDEVLELTKLNGPFHKFNKQKGHNTTAVGKYQIVGSTLRDLNSKDRQVLKKLGITGDTKFDQKTQDDIAAYLAVHRIKDRATKGDGNIATRGQARKEMRNEWEGFKKLSDEELDDIINEVAREVGVTIVETKPSNSVRPPIRPLGRS